MTSPIDKEEYRRTIPGIPCTFSETISRACFPRAAPSYEMSQNSRPPPSREMRCTGADSFVGGKNLFEFRRAGTAEQNQKQVDMALSPSLGDVERQGSHFVSGGGQKVAVVSRHTRACPLVPPTLSSAFLSSLFRLSPKRRRRRDTPLPSPATVLLFYPPYDGTPPPESRDFPTLRDSTTFPFIPAAPSGRRRRCRNDSSAPSCSKASRLQHD